VLTTDDARNLRVDSFYGQRDIEAFLAPVAEAVRNLPGQMVTSTRPGHCEDCNACVMWFYAHTKGTAKRCRRQVRISHMCCVFEREQAK